MAQQCEWTGTSGNRYQYEIYPINTNWNDVAGNYIFAKITTRNRWAAVYIGETESLRDRIPNHNKLPCVSRNGGTHVHAHVNSSSTARLAEEGDLLAANNTSCNG